ncbi:hypothetical protein NDU88_009781 [Pleurodeles waltl]|uniref:Uncharacterized protein n=1 Tax=Pleurodeles waltl TaxID=8319 RepID=A0AAV7QYH3_PLEWA|nr:hypothetical protein NDU88_009781 [Pleurodeles waltl]
MTSIRVLWVLNIISAYNTHTSFAPYFQGEKVRVIRLQIRGCDPEDAEPGWPLRPPDREEELRRRTQATGTRCECCPELGRARVTKREQRWAEVRRAGRRWVTPGEAEATSCG